MHADLEIALLNFMLIFKVQIFGDPRMILYAAVKNPNKKDDDDTYDSNNDTQQAFETLAQLMNFDSIGSIMSIFAEKLLENLVYSDGSTDDGRRVIEVTLASFDNMISTMSSCRHLVKLDIIKQLISNHMAQFNILQNDAKQKHLG